MRSVVELAAARQAKIVLMAPTGRAAKRLSELTGHPAATVHRLLELRPGGDASYDQDHPLDADLVVVDECSMMDLILANKLVKAMPPGAHLLLVGDVDQLPSVGAGQVLRDLLATEAVPRVRLTQDLPSGAGIRHRHQRPSDQRRAVPAAARIPGFLLLSVRGHRAGRRARGGRRDPPHPAQVRPGSAARRPGARARCTAARRARAT